MGLDGELDQAIEYVVPCQHLVELMGSLCMYELILRAVSRMCIGERCSS